MTARFRDNLTYDGAHDLARRLDHFWHRQGYDNVAHRVERDATRSLYYVRSNLVAGLPPPNGNLDRIVAERLAVMIRRERNSDG